MIGRIITALLLTTLLAGCTGYKMGDVLAKASTTVSQQPTATEEIGVVVYKKHSTYPWWNHELNEVSSRVFSRYGWRPTQSTLAPVAVKLTISRGQHVYPGYVLLYFVGIGTLPTKDEKYYTVEAEVFVNGVAQEKLTYTGNATGYMTAMSPVALIMPGITHRDGLTPEPPAELRGQILVQIMEHIAEDIKAKYFSGNHQKLTI